MATRRGDALLEHAHLISECGLVSHGGRHAAEQRRHFRSRLGEAEDVVDKEEHILLLHVAEVLRHRQCGERHPQTRAGGLIHLTKDQRGLVDDTGLGHLQEKIVALAGALPHASEDRHPTEVLRDPIDHLLDQHGLADPGTSEEADFATLDIGGEQVDDLDTGGEDLGLGLQLVEGRC